MGFFAKLFGIGAAAGAAVAAVKVAQKYEENKAAENTATAEAAAAAAQAMNLEGATVQPAQDMTPDVLEDVKKAAAEVFDDAKTAVLSTAEKAGVNTDELTASLAGAGKAIVDAGKAVAGKVQEEAPAAIEKAKSKANEVIGQVKEAVAGVTEEGGVDELKAAAQEFAQSAVETAKDVAADVAEAVEEGVKKAKAAVTHEDGAPQNASADASAQTPQPQEDKPE